MNEEEDFKDLCNRVRKFLKDNDTHTLDAIIALYCFTNVLCDIVTEKQRQQIADKFECFPSITMGLAIFMGVKTCVHECMLKEHKKKTLRTLATEKDGV